MPRRRPTILPSLVCACVAAASTLTFTDHAPHATVHAAELPTFAPSDIDSSGRIAYVDTLSQCTFKLVNSYCGADGAACNGFDASGTADINTQCAIGVTAADAAAVAAAEAASETEANPCAGSAERATYNEGFHIGGIFVILGASFLGALLPVAGKYVPALKVHPYALLLGKSAGVGVIIAVALIHMLLPANEMLTSECLSKAFTEDYEAYAFLFCTIAIFVMHFIDYIAESYLVEKMEEALEAQGHNPDDDQARSKIAAVAAATGVVCVEPRNGLKQSDEEPNVVQFHECADVHSPSELVNITKVPCTSPCETDLPAPSATRKSVENEDSGSDLEKGTAVTDPTVVHIGHHAHDHHEHHHGHGHGHGHAHHGHGHGSDAMAHGHAHSVLFLSGLKRTISAYLLEFGVTTHSIFIGLTIGIVEESGLKALLVALVFHQFFEGMALGSRVAEAPLHNHVEEAAMILIFALSAPLGMAIGVGIQSSLNTEGANYSYTAGIFDAICAGILLYLGLMLLLKDFPDDLRAVSSNGATGVGRVKDTRLRRIAQAKRIGLFLALWIGAGVMAFIGRYL